MAQPYSERFVARSAGPGETSYTVPAGQRAIVRDVEAYSNTPTSSSVYLIIAGLTMWAGTLSGAGASTGQRDLHLVAYAGETVAVYTSGSNTNAMACGYLLADPP